MLKFNKIVALACASAMMLSTVASATSWDYTSPSPEGTMDSVMPEKNNVYEAFYTQYGFENAADVYYNGEYIYFEDAQPVVLSGTTFVPIRAFTDALGAEIEYIEATHSVKITRDDSLVSFDIGSADVNVNGEIITLPVNTFETYDRTMVPVRLISEAFDLDVSWNEMYKEVSILDLKTLKDGIDTKYTLMDSFLQMSAQSKLTSNQLVTGDINLSLAAEGEEIVVSSNVECVVDKDMSSMSYVLDTSIDLGDLEKEFEALSEDPFAPDEYKEYVQTLLKMIKSFKINYVFDIDNFDIYFQSDVLGFLLGSVMGTSIEMDSNTWIKISYSDLLTEEQLTELNTQMDLVTSGEYTLSTETLVDLTLDSCKDIPIASFNYYEMLDTILNYVKDENFEKSGSTYTLTVDETMPDNTNIFSEFALKTNSSGQVTSYSLTANFSDGLNSQNIIAFELSQPSTSKVILNFDLNIDDLGTSFHINCNLTTKNTTKSPIKIPTENVVDFMSLVELPV